MALAFNLIEASNCFHDNKCSGHDNRVSIVFLPRIIHLTNVIVKLSGFYLSFKY